MSTLLLDVQNMTKRFGGFQALSAVDLTVTSGERFGLIGPNGSGKTTLINCISGTLRHDTGRIRFDGVDITSTLTPNIPFTIDQRDVTLSGRLADGAPFSFELTSIPAGSYHIFGDFFDSSTHLTVTFVPEPTTALMMSVVGGFGLGRRRLTILSYAIR